MTEEACENIHQFRVLQILLQLLELFLSCYAGVLSRSLFDLPTHGFRVGHVIGEVFGGRNGDWFVPERNGGHAFALFLLGEDHRVFTAVQREVVLAEFLPLATRQLAGEERVLDVVD